MARRTKAWWAALTPVERIRLTQIERGGNGSGFGSGGFLPDDWSECDACGEPQLGSGTCQHCLNELTTIIQKADAAVGQPCGTS